MTPSHNNAVQILKRYERRRKKLKRISTPSLGKLALESSGKKVTFEGILEAVKDFESRHPSLVVEVKIVPRTNDAGLKAA